VEVADAVMDAEEVEAMNLKLVELARLVDEKGSFCIKHTKAKGPMRSPSYRYNFTMALEDPCLGLWPHPSPASPPSAVA